VNQACPSENDGLLDISMTVPLKTMPIPSFMMFFVKVRISIEKLATTILKLANMSKEADKIVKSAREWESKTLNNEVEIEELDKQMREARRIGLYTFFTKSIHNRFLF